MSKVWTPEDIEAFEDGFAVKCTLRSDGLYDIKGTINISDQVAITGKDIESLSDIIPPIYDLYGRFNCSYNHLLSLNGSPRYVSEDFICIHNELINLNDAPMHVGNKFDCRFNPNLRFTRKQLDAMNIQGGKYFDPWQLIIEDPSEFIERGLLPI